MSLTGSALHEKQLLKMPGILATDLADSGQLGVGSGQVAVSRCSRSPIAITAIVALPKTHATQPAMRSGFFHTRRIASSAGARAIRFSASSTERFIVASL